MTEILLRRLAIIGGPKPGVSMDFELISPTPASTFRDACLALFAAADRFWDFNGLRFEFGEMYTLETGVRFKTYPQDSEDVLPDRTIEVICVRAPEEFREALREIPRILGHEGVINEQSKVDFVKKIDEGLARLRADTPVAVEPAPEA